MQTSSGRVVATSFFYLTVHRWIAGDVPSYLKFALKVIHPRRKTPIYNRFRLIVPQPWELARKIQLAPTGSRPRAFQRAIVEPCTLPISPPKGGSKILHLALPFISSFQVIVDISNLRLTMWVEHSKSQPTDDKMSLKWAWPRHVTHFKLLVRLRYTWNGLS